MNTLLALTLSSTLTGAAAGPAPAPAPRPSLMTQAAAIAAAAPVPVRSSFAPPGGDSLKNGAVIGGVLVGVGFGGFVGLLCNALQEPGDPSCLKATLMAAGIGAAGGAVLGAGVDALFVSAPGARVRFRF